MIIKCGNQHQKNHRLNQKSADIKSGVFAQFEINRNHIQIQRQQYNQKSGQYQDGEFQFSDIQKQQPDNSKTQYRIEQISENNVDTDFCQIVFGQRIVKIIAFEKFKKRIIKQIVFKSSDQNQSKDQQTDQQKSKPLRHPQVFQFSMQNILPRRSKAAPPFRR